MSLYESIAKRRSVRTFDGNALKEEDARKIMDFAASVDNPYGIPIAWKLLDKQYGLSSPVIVGTDVFFSGKMCRTPHAEEAFGYAFEKIVLFAESIGVGTTWIAGTMNRASFEAAMAIDEDEVMPCISPLGYPAQKMSIREMLMRKGIKADVRLDFRQLFFDGSFDNPLAEEKAGIFKKPLNAVRVAPSAVNKQPWRVVLCGDKVHFFEKQSKGFVSANGWDLQKIDVGIALCHFEIAAREAGIDFVFEIKDPELAVAEDIRYIASYKLK